MLDGRFYAHIVSREPQLTIIIYDSSSGRELNLNERILEQVAESAESKPLKVIQFQRSDLVMQKELIKPVMNNSGWTGYAEFGHLVRVFCL